MSSVSPDTKASQNGSEIAKTPTKSTQTKRKVGRPTKYKKRYAQEIVEYFDQRPWVEEIPYTITSKNGNVITKHELRPKQLRFLVSFADKIGVSMQTIHEWIHKHAEFYDAYAHAKELYKEHLAICGSAGLFNSHFTQFLAKNTTDWTDRSVVEHDGKVESTVFFENMLNKAKETRHWLPAYKQELVEN